MDLNNAEIAVTTQHLIDIKDYRDYWLHLSDYSDMGEFLSACSDLFPGENHYGICKILRMRELCIKFKK